MIFQPGCNLAEIERRVIVEALQHFDGNRTHTADALGISIRGLRNKLREYRADAQFSAAYEWLLESDDEA